MIRARSWRRFDYLLLVLLLVLSVYGVTMIYSATLNTLGVEDAFERQIAFVITGTAILLVTAAVDYRLLELLQHPVNVLTPLVLVVVCAALFITWGIEGLSISGGLSLGGAPLAQFKPLLVGIVLIVVVFAADRVWLEGLDLGLSRLVLAALVVVAAAGGLLVFPRLQQGALSNEAIAGFGDLSGYTGYLLVGGLAVAYLLDCLTLRYTDMLRNPIYVLTLFLLGAILVIGQAAGGSQRWLGAGKVQPSEMAKILLIVVLAHFLAKNEERMGHIGTVLVSLASIAAPMLLIYLQPDLGTALSLVAIWAAMIWMAKIRFRHLIVLIGVAVAVLPLAWFGLEDYMRQRLLLFINPASDPDSYFNVHQALVSIGSGGWAGKGLTHGTQSQLHFLRVRHTDFIFAVTAEEVGFLGALAMMVLLFFVLWRILRIAERSRDVFGRLLATGVGALIFFQAVINIGMNLGLTPVTGIPLPFVSYGGSSFITLMVGIGLAQSVAMRHKKLEFD
jgi:rod shape determining protein RodA